MNLVNPPPPWSNSFLLPSFYTVGPTKSRPTLDANAIQQVAITGLPLPLAEDFAPDAFAGKVFVRLPRRSQPELHVSGRVARLRSEQPYFGFDSMWLPDHCIRGHNSLERVLEARRGPPASALARARRLRVAGVAA